MSSNIPQLLFKDKQKVNESLLDFINRIAVSNGFRNAQFLLTSFLKNDTFKREFKKAVANYENKNSLPEIPLKEVSFGLYTSVFSAGSLNLKWIDLKILIELILDKDVVHNFYPPTYFSHDIFTSVITSRFFVQKVCPHCWSQDSYVRSYWNYENFNYCYFHKCSLAIIGKKSSEKEEQKPECFTPEFAKNYATQRFFEKFLNEFNIDSKTEVPLDKLEVELILCNTELRLIESICLLFEVLYSKNLRCNEVKTFVMDGGNAFLNPRERIENIIHNLAIDLKTKNEMFSIYVFLFLNYSSKEVYETGFTGNIFRRVYDLNLSFYQDDLIPSVLDSELFSELIDFMLLKQDQLFRRGPTSGALSHRSEVLAVDTDKLYELKEELLSMECLSFFKTSTLKINEKKLIDRVTKTYAHRTIDLVSTDEMFIRNIFVDVVGSLLANLFSEKYCDNIRVINNYFFKRL